MNSRTILAAVAGVILVSGASAQTAQTASATAQARANDRAITDRYLTTVHTELTTRIDTKNAKPGQQVTAQTSEDIQLADGTKLPKGTKLVGRVLLVQAPTGEQPGAALILGFDHAELKGGQTVPVRSVIEMVAPAGRAAASMDNQLPGMGAGPMSTGGNVGIADSSRAGMGGGGGVLGNVGRGVNGRTSTGIDPTGGSMGADPMGGSDIGVPGAPGGVNGTSTTGIGGAQVGGVNAGDPIGAAGPIGSRPIDNAGNPASNFPSPMAQTGVRPVVSAGESVSGSARLTALPGVLLSRSAAAEASGVLTASGRNITLESGTRITMGVIGR
jgi:hypothetical protein